MNKAKGVIFKLIKEAWEIDKMYFFYLLLIIIVETAANLMFVYIPSIVVESVVSSQGIEAILVSLTLNMALVFLLKIVLEYVNMKFKTLNTYQNQMLEIRLSEKSMSIIYEELENPDTLDLMMRAYTPISWGYIEMTLNILKNILTMSFTIIALLVVVFNHSRIYFAILALTLIVSSISILKIREEFDKLIQENVPMNRKSGYFFDAALNPKYQKDYRLFGLSKIINMRQREFDKGILEWAKKINFANTKSAIVESLSTTIIVFMAIAYNSIRLLTDKFGPMISIGKFTLIYNATNTIKENVITIARNLSWINSARVNLSPWKEYLELKDDPNEGKEICEEFESLEFKNVTFSYPNSDKKILDNVSFKINKGERISIVGLNNAGKSTIVKLICRFYQLDSGNIYWNGKDISSYEKSSYTNQLSAVFQDFKLMPFTIVENILPHESNKTKAITSLKKVKMFEAVSQLKKGMDTYLSKDLENDATNFSGGQAQKLAIARAINREGSLMIMDEPTAALDPIAESEIFEQFVELTEGKTSIFISHRMSSSTFSDKILLLDNGKIVGFDSHRNLMKEDNLYRELFETQAKNYAE